MYVIMCTVTQYDNIIIIIGIIKRNQHQNCNFTLIVSEPFTYLYLLNSVNMTMLGNVTSVFVSTPPPTVIIQTQ